jgi:hypothetical protein
MSHKKAIRAILSPGGNKAYLSDGDVGTRSPEEGGGEAEDNEDEEPDELECDGPKRSRVSMERRPGILWLVAYYDRSNVSDMLVMRDWGETLKEHLRP